MQIHNIEGYVALPESAEAFQLTLTDDPYYVTSTHRGQQVSVYSTNRERIGVTGQLAAAIARREGTIALANSYDMTGWHQYGDFWFISQRASATSY